MHDLLGLFDKFAPKFSKRYVNLKRDRRRARCASTSTKSERRVPDRCAFVPLAEDRRGGGQGRRPEADAHRSRPSPRCSASRTRSARGGRTIAFVPTMGALHEGHLSLVREAQRRGDTVVVSIFVNPIQFNSRSDFENYPRDDARDARLLEAAGVRVLFLPTAEEIYPPRFQTRVEVTELTRRCAARTAPATSPAWPRWSPSSSSRSSRTSRCSAPRTTSSSRWCGRWCGT